MTFPFRISLNTQVDNLSLESADVDLRAGFPSTEG